MVDESLKAYLLESVAPHDGDSAFYKDRLQDLMSVSDKTGALSGQDDALIYPEEIPELIKAISTIKIIDPAVGSGAFPMGILQRLVALLRVLDPDNTHWKQQQLDIAGTLPDPISREQTMANIESIFSPQNAHNDYGRKLYLIESSIYGVDIQPIAIQICKLRFFISLTIEQNPNQDKNDNYGIKALPNLETKFIVANSLLPLGEMPDQGDVFEVSIAKLQEQLAEIRHKYFSAKTLKTKRKYRKKDKTLRQQMLAEFIESNDKPSGITPTVEASMRKIINWDLYNQNAIADWFDPEWQFGVKDGFDIVIGNPPYIQLQKDGGRLGNLYQDCGFKTFARSGDIYQLFYEKGMALLTEAQGILAFITSNSWMRAKYGDKLRRFFSMEHSPLRLIDMGKDAFGAIVDTNILLVRKGNAEQIFKAVDMDSMPEKHFPPAEQYWSEIHPSGDMSWSVLSPAAQKIRAKIEQIGTPLKDWDIKISFGIKTGYNEAFIIDTSKRDELVAQDPKSTEIIKPILRGRDIRRYGYKWAGKWIINSHNGDKNNAPIDIEDYPAIKNHLNQHYPQLEKRQDKGITPYNLRNCAYLEEFEKEKLIWKRIGSILRFSFDDKGHFPLDSTCIITGERIKFLVAVLNSRFGNYLLKDSPTTGMGDLIISVQAIEPILVPRISTKNHQIAENVEKLVDKIFNHKQQAQDTSALETQIDQLVYNLYHLTTDEINIIEGTK